jgi:PIN domain nuclease of toxin-antitoxin system
MRLLLDTHVAIWLETGSARLRGSLRERLTQADDLTLSVVVPWEMTLLRARRRIAPDIPLIGVEEPARHGPVLPVTAVHITVLATLPWHHADPFDRMLIAQAQAEGLVIVTADRAIRAYDVAVLPA